MQLIYPIGISLINIGRYIGVREIHLAKNIQARMICERLDDQLERITAIAMSANRQCLAVACTYRNDKSAYIFFYDTVQAKRFKRIIKTIHEGSPTDNEYKYFISIAFSPEAKHIVALTNLQDGNVKMYEWKKDRVITASSWVAELKRENKENDNMEITKVTIDPANKDQVVMSGRYHARVWRNQGGILKPLPIIPGLEQTNVYTDHAWVENTWTIFGTDAGELYFILEGRQCVIRANAFESIMEPVSCIFPYYRGLVIGGGNGQISLWEKMENAEDATKRDFVGDREAQLKQAFKFEQNLSISIITS